jgi:Ca-activated chloride channel family protein
MITFGNMKYGLYVALIVGILLILYGIYLLWRWRILSRLFTPEQKLVMLRGRSAVRVVKDALIIVSLIIAGIILLRPQWGERIREVNREGVDVLIALDVSRSMSAQDVSPSRLKRARDTVKLIAECLQGDRIGLILFAGDAFLQCPLTDDIGAFMMFLDSIGHDSVRVQGTDIGRALETARRVFAKRRMTSRVLVVITDGEDHEGKAITAARQFSDLDVKIYTVGIGRNRGEPIPLQDSSSGTEYLRDMSGHLVRTQKESGLLREIARETGGFYVDITGNLSGVYRILADLSTLTKNEYGTRVVRERKEQYQIFALLLIIILTGEILLAERREVRE